MGSIFQARGKLKCRDRKETLSGSTRRFDPDSGKSWSQCSRKMKIDKTERSRKRERKVKSKRRHIIVCYIHQEKDVTSREGCYKLHKRKSSFSFEAQSCPPGVDEKRNASDVCPLNLYFRNVIMIESFFSPRAFRSSPSSWRPGRDKKRGEPS